MPAVPIIRLGDNLVVTVQQALHDRLAMELQDDITTAISRTGARGLLIDVSVIDVVDSFMGRMLGDIATMARLMGTTTVLVGIQPAVAVTLTELGLELIGIHTALNLEKGLALLDRVGKPAGGAGRRGGVPRRSRE